MKYLIILFLLASCSNIKTTNSFKEVNFNQIQNNDLVIFDVDETLMQPIDSYLINEQTKEAQIFRQNLVQKHPKIKDWDSINSIVLEQADRPLLEPILVSEIENLKNRGIKVIFVPK